MGKRAKLGNSGLGFYLESDVVGAPGCETLSSQRARLYQGALGHPSLETALQESVSAAESLSQCPPKTHLMSGVSHSALSVAEYF